MTDEDTGPPIPKPLVVLKLDRGGKLPKSASRRRSAFGTVPRKSSRRRQRACSPSASACLDGPVPIAVVGDHRRQLAPDAEPPLGQQHHRRPR